MYLFLQLGLMFTNGFAPNKGVAIGIGLDLGTIHKVMLQRHVFFVSQKLKHGCKYRFKDIPHSLGTEAIQRAEVGALPSGDPHKGNVLPYCFGDLTRGIHSLGVSVDNDFGEHLRVIAVAAAAGVSRVKDGVV
ncbi:hypothetical protein D3C74_356980 [compost metagenome]